MALSAEVRERREAAGLSLAELTYRIRDFLPRNRWVSLETLRRYETGVTTEDKADAVLLTAVAEACGCTLSDLSPKVASDAQALKVLLSRSRCFSADSALA